MKKIITTISVLFVLGSGSVISSNLIATDHNHVSGDTISHSGRTNSEGCHNDRKRGTYHCH